jgi:anti-sigma regulatory factor (Ser/Thr protein kinase)
MDGRMVEETACVAFPVDASTPALARRAGELFQRDAGIACDGLDLVISELVTNAVRHATRTVEMTLHHAGDGLTVEVRDDSPDAPTGRDAADSDHAGRGLAIVQAIAGCWSVAWHADGTKMVSARLRCTPLRPPVG